MKKLMLCFSILLTMVGCQDKTINHDDGFKIVVATDLHYFAKEYYQDCEWFEDSLLSGDGKMVVDADEIIQAFIKKMLEVKPDLVVITGDLTFNGEINSHKKVAEYLSQLEEHQIEVVVINGNHDVDNIFAKGYGKDDYFKVNNINGKEFAKIYKNLGYDIAVDKHKDSLSYEVSLNNHYSLLVIDTCMHDMTIATLDNGGIITDSTKKWLHKRLKSIKDKNKIPLIAMHHNLGKHNEKMYHGFTLINSDEVTSLLKEYNVPLVMSGHVHLQHVLDVKGIKEVTTSSLLVNPLQYGVIQLTENKIKYHTEPLLISKDSQEYFKKVAFQRFKGEKVLNDEEEAKIEMLSLLNMHYFAGTVYKVKDEILKSRGYQLINQKDSIYSYVQTMLNNDENYTQFEININQKNN